MGSKERIHRLKEQTRVNILDAAYDIVKDEGWQALSMRKIADKIKHLVPHKLVVEPQWTVLDACSREDNRRFS